MSAGRRNALLWCVVLLGLALFFRLVYLQVAGIEVPENDAKEYSFLARNLAEGRGFTSDGVTPSTYRPPLFSWLLGGWCSVLRSTSLRTMIAFQVLVQSICSPLTYLLMFSIGQARGTALVGGLFIASYPFLVSTVRQLLQEPTQMLAVLGIGLAMVAWCRRPSWPRATASGLLFGFAALAKAPFLAAPVAVVIVMCMGREYRRQLPFGQVALACVLTAAVVLPWTLRNYEVTGGRFVLINSQNLTYPVWLVADDNFHPRDSLSEPLQEPFTSQTGVALTYGNPDGFEYLRRTNEDLLRKGLTGIPLREGLAVAARVYLMRHPLYLLRLTLRGLVLLFSPDASSGLSQFLMARLIAMALFHLPLAAGWVAGTLRAAREKNGALMALALLTALYLLAHAPGTGGGGRYSAPFLPILIAVGAYGLRTDRSTSRFSRTTSNRVPNRSGQPSSTLSSRLIQGSHRSG